MDAGNWISLITIAVTGLGGGGVMVARLTRIAIAAENLADKIAEVSGRVAKVGETVQDHENRLNKAKL